MLIDNSYFFGSIDLPGRESNDGTAEALTDFVTRYEPEFLYKALGRAFAKLFIAAYEASIEEPPVDLAARWVDLLEGKEYEVDGKTYVWQGLVHEVSDDLSTSPIANYVYYIWRKFMETQTGNIGEAKPKSINADSVSPAQKMVYAWNEMVDILWEMVHFLDNNKSTYPEWDLSLTDYNVFQKINTFGI